MPNPAKRESISNARNKFYILLFIIILLVIISLVFHSRGFTLKNFKEISSSKYAPFIYILVFIMGSFAPIPAFIPLIFAGMKFFSFYEVFVYVLAGQLIFASLIFMLTRWLGRDYAEQWESKHEEIRNMDLKFHEHAFRDIFLLRLFFIIPSEAVSILCGLSKIKYHEFILATTLGTIPVILATIFLSISRAAGNEILFFQSILMFCLLLVIPVIYLYNLRLFLKHAYRKIR